MIAKRTRFYISHAIVKGSSATLRTRKIFRTTRNLSTNYQAADLQDQIHLKATTDKKKTLADLPREARRAMEMLYPDIFEGQVLHEHLSKRQREGSSTYTTPRSTAPVNQPPTHTTFQVTALTIPSDASTKLTLKPKRTRDDPEDEVTHLRTIVRRADAIFDALANGGKAQAALKTWNEVITDHDPWQGGEAVGGALRKGDPPPQGRGSLRGPWT